MREVTEGAPVCPFGLTGYDSRILDNIYRSWGDEDGGTVVSAYWKDELKAFRVAVPYAIIKNLLENRQIGSLCNNYDWQEVSDLKKLFDDVNDGGLKTNKMTPNHTEVKIIIKDILKQDGRTPVIYDRIDITVNGYDKEAISEIINQLREVLK